MTAWRRRRSPVRDTRCWSRWGRRRLSSVAAVLAQALFLQGLHHEASRFAEISRRLADTNDVISQFQWRVARARVVAAEGRLEEACRLASAAVDQLAASDLPFLQGQALLDLADILRQAGRFSEAVQAADAAVERYERKGATVLRDHAAAFLDELLDEQPAQV